MCYVNLRQWIPGEIYFAVIMTKMVGNFFVILMDNNKIVCP